MAGYGRRFRAPAVIQAGNRERPLEVGHVDTERPWREEARPSDDPRFGREIMASLCCVAGKPPAYSTGSLQA